ncbi:MAG: hypothetical protein FWE04_06845 [Oscillospiraceae bacterium]|nr:hypothetical protein [Oscillospiraceae bacterium]
MAAEKISFEQFLEAVDENYKPFIQNLHSYLSDNSCKAAFEEKKSGFIASYKYGKPPRALAYMFFKKNGMLVRIYGENVSEYNDFLNTLPPEMVQSIAGAGICGRLVNNTCSLKCTGYDFTIGDEHFQKCRYNCFEFSVTDENNPYIKLFVESEIKARMA